MPADREHYLFRGDAGAVRQMGGKHVAVLFDGLDDAARDDGDAAPFYLGASMRADVVVEAAQDVITAMDQGDVAAETGEDASKLQRNVTAALDNNTRGQFRQMKRLVRGDYVVY